MENILELFYDLPTGRIHSQDSPFVRAARIKNEAMDTLSDTLTNEQKDLLDTYFEADSKTQYIINFGQFRYAFHLGARLMEELIEGKDELQETP